MLPSESILLLVEIPRTNDKKELAAEQMFAALHGILQPQKKGLFKRTSQEHISFEIVSIKQQIHFYVWTRKDLKNFIEGQIYAQYSTAQIFDLGSDYTARDLQQPVIHTIELGLNTHDSIPIKTFPNFEVDPLSGITAALARLDPDEELWIQVLARPIADDWHERGSKHIKKIESGSNINFGSLVSAAFQPPDDSPDKKPNLNERDKSRVEAIKQKNTKLGYQVKIRVLYAGQTEELSKLRMQAIVGAFKQFNTTNLNGFAQKKGTYDKYFLDLYRQRDFSDDGFILNIEELASVFHLPHTSVDTPNIVWASAKTAEPPSSLPTTSKHPPNEVSLFGATNFRSSNSIFGGLRSDRGRHIYVIGQTGTGKSGLLELLSLSDLHYNYGYAIIDPHGDFAINNLRAIPANKVPDVVYFNPADTDYPIGFNPLEVTDPRQKVQTSSELVGVMKRMFDSWGPRLEYILRNTILALLDTPGSTMLDITRMLTEKKFRKMIVGNVTDVVVRNFWESEFNSWDHRFQTEAVAPVLNKVGAFTSNPMVRNIIGQPKSGFNLRQIMDEGKILILNLSRGLIGEDNASILGAMIITKIQLAAMSRADIADIEDRRPFYLYVDEFQNFATDSFAVILSEARKYGLYLTLANQYISQMPEEVRSAVFGNVGSIVSFRASPDDAPLLEKYFNPQFETSDIIQLANRSFVATLTIAGQKVPAFSGQTLDLPNIVEDNLEAIINHSRYYYATPREVVEQQIEQNTSSQPQQLASTPLSSNPALQSLKASLQAPGAPQTTPSGETTGNSNASQPTSGPKKRRRRRTRSPKAQTSDNNPIAATQQQEPAPTREAGLSG